MKRLLLRIVPLTLAIASIGGGAWAATGHGGVGSGNASERHDGPAWGHTNYRPGKGCGDTNHVHYRESEC